MKETDTRSDSQKITDAVSEATGRALMSPMQQTELKRLHILLLDLAAQIEKVLK